MFILSESFPFLDEVCAEYSVGGKYRLNSVSPRLSLWGARFLSFSIFEKRYFTYPFPYFQSAFPFFTRKDEEYIFKSWHDRIFPVELLNTFMF